MDDGALSRRRMLKVAAVAALTAAAAPRSLLLPTASAAESAEAKPSAMLRTRVARPYDAETDVAAFREWITPTEALFVRSHFGPPPAATLDPASWRLSLAGLVRTPHQFSLEDLARFESVTLTAVLQCSGNGRAHYRPRVPGVQWERGAVGNVRWTGVRLADVLRRAGVDLERAKHVQLEGADRPVLPTTPLFYRSIPLTRALHPDTLLATHLNDAPLTALHGGPLRLVVPGWMADGCTKWLTGVTVQAQESEGYYMQTAYRYPEHPVEPGAAPSTGSMKPVEEMIVKSLIASPAEGTTVTGDQLTVRGVAWTGDGLVTRVEVSTDAGQRWQDATLLGEDLPYAWRKWEWRGSVPAGACTLLCRATDSSGAVQPEQSPWNPGGFLWNGWDRVTVTVQA